MIATRRTLAAGAVWILMIASPLLAHHTWAVDRTRAVTVKGTVTGFNWSNPHVEIFLDAKDGNGIVEKWTAAGPSTGRMAGSGWDRNILKQGDLITVIGYRATDGSTSLRLETVVLSNGQELAFYGNR